MALQDEPARRPAGAWIWRGANEVLAFLLELAALAALGRWGYAVGAGALGGGAAGGLLLAAGVPLGAAVLWGLFAAPKARIPLPLPAVLLVKALVLGGAAAALDALGHPFAAALAAVVLVANTAVLEVGRRRRTLPHRA